MQLPNFGNPHVTAKRWASPAWGAMLFLFAHIDRDLFEYVEADGLNVTELLRAFSDRNGFSINKELMLKTALDIYDPECLGWNDDGAPGLGRLVWELDQPQLALIMQAILIARGTMSAADYLKHMQFAPDDLQT